MITEERVMALLARANPEPDDGFDLASDAAAYLASLEQRSSVVTELKSEPARQSARPTRQWGAWKWVTAAFAVVIGAGAILLAVMVDDTEVAQSDIEVVESLMEAWNTSDGEAIASHFTADGTLDLRPGEGSIQEPWVGRTRIAEMTTGYSERHPWEASFDYTALDGVIVFNRTVVQDGFTESGLISKPQGVSVVITDGKIESLIVEIDSLHYCIGDTATRCKVRDTGEVRLSE